MALPLSSILNAAPGIISAATDIIGMIRKNRQKVPDTDTARYDELAALIEQQAAMLEELALNNRNLVLAVRNNRIVALAGLIAALTAIGIAIVLH